VFRLWQASHKSKQGWKVSFWGSVRGNSVWILKWTTLLGIFCKLRFTPTLTSCCQVHALNADSHLFAALLCCLRCNWCQNFAAVNCILHWIVLILSTLQMGITLVTVRSWRTELWLHHKHKISYGYHKNGLISSHQSVGRWFIFMCFVVRIFWWNQLAINSLPVSVSRWNSWLEQFRFHVNYIHFRRAVFVHVGLAQLCTGKGVSFYMCSAAEVAWLAQNIRQSSTRVRLHLQWRLGVSGE